MFLPNSYCYVDLHTVRSSICIIETYVLVFMYFYMCGMLVSFETKCVFHEKYSLLVEIFFAIFLFVSILL